MTFTVSTFSAIQHHDEIPDNFVYLREVVPGIAEDVSYYSENNFIGERVPGYEAPRVILTLEAALALRQVQHDLSYAGLALKVFDGYRPQRAVDFFGQWAANEDDIRRKNEYYPNLDKKDLFPLGYLVKQSSHSRGSTVDLTLIDALNGNEVDMGTPFDYFDLLSWPSALSIAPEQRANRLLLRLAMTGRGFVPVEEEWWHFTLENEPYPHQYFDFVIR